MKTNEITLNNAINNEYSLHLNCVRGKVNISYYDEENNMHKGECNDAISYDRYNELLDWCEGEDEQEFLNLYKYFIDLCD